MYVPPVSFIEQGGSIIMDRDKLEDEYQKLIADPQPFKREKEYKVMHMKLLHGIWSELAIANGGFKPVKVTAKSKKK